jgi:hypothetical protein
MSSGILRSWYLSKIAKSTTPLEYFFAMQEFMLYEMSVFSFNTRKYFQPSL